MDWKTRCAPWRWLCWLIVVASLSAGCDNYTPNHLPGYVEGETLYLAAPVAGQLQETRVERGDRVTPGQVIFLLNQETEASALREDLARIAAARARLENLLTPHRASEIAMAESQRDAAAASLRYSTARLQRLKPLVQAKNSPPQDLDLAQSTRDRDAAQLTQLEEQIRNFKEPLGRTSEIAAAQAELAVAQAQADQRQWLVEHKIGKAPVAGEITERFRQPGEWLPAGTPVVSLLPDERRHLRFFVPEPRLATLKIGQTIWASCDSCPAKLTATISFIASQAEYTPPVIFSQEQRVRLVFRAEARVAPELAPSLRPGLPVSIMLESGS